MSGTAIHAVEHIDSGSRRRALAEPPLPLSKPLNGRVPMPKPTGYSRRVWLGSANTNEPKTMVGRLRASLQMIPKMSYRSRKRIPSALGRLSATTSWCQGVLAGDGLSRI